MKKTRERILDSALFLFNTYGLPKVTLRTIAKDMGISQGNLNYHFKKRSDIIEALYIQLVQNISTEMSKLQKGEIDLALMARLGHTIKDNFFEYRFFMLDFVQIMRENEKIKNHYRELSKQREQQFIEMFYMLVREGILREERFANEYYHFYLRLQILGDFWISSAEVATNKVTKKTADKYFGLIMESIYPYLTEKGLAQYAEVTPTR